MLRFKCISSACIAYRIFLFIFSLTQYSITDDVDGIEIFVFVQVQLYASIVSTIVSCKDVINNFFFSMPQNYRWMQNCIYVLNLINHNDRANVVFCRQKIVSERERKKMIKACFKQFATILLASIKGHERSEYKKVYYEDCNFNLLPLDLCL